MGETSDKRVCVGVIVGAHGVRGQVRIKSYTQAPENLAGYGPLTDETGRRQFRVSLTGQGKGMLRARIEGVDDRDAAEALRGTRLYLSRGALPAPEDAEEYYHADLVGLLAEDPQGRALGRVTAVHNYGAGDLLEIGEAEAAFLVPFTRAVVPRVDLAAGRLVVDRPAEIAVPQD